MATCGNCNKEIGERTDHYCQEPPGTASSGNSELLTRCCKCGADDADIKWSAHKQPYETTFGRRVTDNEHLVLACRRCGYKWKEKPLDKRKAG